MFSSTVPVTLWKPPIGYQIPSASSVYCNKLYVPGASNGLIPMYILANVKTLLSLSVQKYLLARYQMLSNGCSSIKCSKKSKRAMLSSE